MQRSSVKLIVGIAGPSGAGKSLIVQKLVERWPDRILHVKTDNYFIDYNKLPRVGRWHDWDRPECIDWKRLKIELNQLLIGNKVQSSYLDKKTLIRFPLVLIPKEIIVLEGFLLFWKKAVRDSIDVKIFLDIPEKEIVLRREFKKGLPDDGYVSQIVISAYRKYILPTKKFADFIINATQPPEKIFNQIKSIISSYVTIN